ncbi:MAG: M3 family metallopeptidase [Ignavibacteria bacterium]|nr:M3 family metallopeptidase [Ignavibacteria bacterium]
MKKIIFISALFIISILPEGTMKENNPLLKTFDLPPFEEIKEEHFIPAYKYAIEQHNNEIKEIAENKTPADFVNTVEAIDYSGRLLVQVNSIFSNLTSANTNDEMQKISKQVAPLLSAHSDDINLNKTLFERIKAVYEVKDKLNLTVEQNMLLDKYYKQFVRGGAALSEADKAELRKINERLSVLSVSFGENVLKENNRFELILENKDDLAGLPESVIDAAFKSAQAKGYAGKWLFTIQKPSLIPFLQYSQKRNLREKMYKAYIMKGDYGDELDNKKIISEMVSLRIKKANLLGYKTHADFILDENMAKTPARVAEFLDKLWVPAVEMAKLELSELQKIADKEGKGIKIQPWDWWYYSEKIRKEKYDLDENELRPYFKLENVRKGAFLLAKELFGIEFKKLEGIQIYDPEVEVFEVTEENGNHIGVFYTDFFPRSGKGGGAWMSSFRKQYKTNGINVSPVIVNVCNFTRPTEKLPSLLSLEEVETLFHEFGHALHGLLSNSNYPRLSGTSVSRDFVELPSQIMENWVFEPDFLKLYAFHYETGEVIPEELILKIKNSSKFNQGFATLEYLAASYLDMDWHTLTDTTVTEVNDFEKKSMGKIGLLPEIEPRYRSTYFSHIFSGGYSSGYYSYIWAEVLDADAFQAFKEEGLLDRETGMSFRRNILEKGGTEEPMKLYIKFRGKEPSVEPLLKNRGLDKLKKGRI